MKIRERLQIIGQAIRGESQPEIVKEIVKEIKANEKLFTGSTLDFQKFGLSDAKTVSSKVLEANKGWVYRNTDAIAAEVASIEFELFTTRLVGKEIVFEPITQHPLLDALDRFNEFTSSSDGFYTTESHRLLAGDCFWYVDGQGVNIKGIYPLQPDKVTLKFGEVAKGQRIIDAYEFKDTIDGTPVEEVYAPEEIVHHKVPNPKNPYRGLGKVEAAADAIDTDTYAIEANKQLFKRGLISNFVLSTSNKLTDEQLKQLHAEFKSSFQGVENAFKVPIFGSDLKPVTVQSTNRETQFLEQQAWLRDKITSIWGNNKASIGITDDVNRANAEESILLWKRSTVRNEMKAITDTINEFLVPRFGTNLILGFKDPVPEDENEKIDKVVKLKNSDLVTVNEAREIIDLDPVEGGDEFGFQRQERQQAQLGEIPKALKYVKLDKFLRKSGMFKQKEQYIQLQKTVRPYAEQMIKNRKKQTVADPVKEHETFSNEKVWEFHRKQIALVDVQEKIFRNKIEQFINAMVQRSLENVGAEFVEMKNKQLINTEDEVLSAVIDFRPLLTEVALASGQQALSLIGENATYLGFNVRKTVEANIRKFAQSMVETDREKMIDIIAQGITDGDSVPKIKRNILTAFEEFSKMQAERITRTEVIRSSNLGSMDAWRDSGVVVGKQWLTAMDDRTDPLCAYMNGKVVGLSKNYFDKGDVLEINDMAMKFDYGSVKTPPLHPNCRCTLLPVLVNQNSFDAENFLKIKGLEQDKAELEAKIDKRTKKFKELGERNLELEQYVKELEGLLDEPAEISET